MKRSQAVGGQSAVSSDPGWERILEQIKSLSADQRLKLSENIKSSAIADIQHQQEKLQGELAHLSGLLGSPNAARPRDNTPLPEGSTTADRVLAILRRGGNKTVKQIQAEAGTPWVNTALSQLVQSRQIVNDGKRPAAYSIAR